MQSKTGTPRELRSESAGDVEENGEGTLTSTSTTNPLIALAMKKKEEERARTEQMYSKEDLLSVSTDLPEKQRLRNSVLNELVRTERDYIVDLDTIINHFRNPLKVI